MDHSPSLNRGEESLVAGRLRPARLRSDDTQFRMVLALVGKLDQTLPVLSNESPALRRRPTSRVRDRKECEHCAKEEGRVLRPRAAAQWVALLVLVVPNGGHDEVGAVHRDHARLRQAGARVILLHGRMNTHDCDDDAEGEVEGDEEAVERAPGPGEEGVEDTGERDCGGVHARSRADENPLPEVRVGLFPVLKASLRPGVREVNEEDEAEEDEYGCAYHGDIVAPEHEEAVRDEERHDDQDDPEQNLGTPPSVCCYYTTSACIGYPRTRSVWRPACPSYPSRLSKKHRGRSGTGPMRSRCGGPMVPLHAGSRVDKLGRTARTP